MNAGEIPQHASHVLQRSRRIPLLERRGPGCSVLAAIDGDEIFRPGFREPLETVDEVEIGTGKLLPPKRCDATNIKRTQTLKNPALRARSLEAQ